MLRNRSWFRASTRTVSSHWHRHPWRHHPAWLLTYAIYCIGICQPASQRLLVYCRPAQCTVRIRFRTYVPVRRDLCIFPRFYTTHMNVKPGLQATSLAYICGAALQVHAQLRSCKSNTFRGKEYPKRSATDQCMRTTSKQLFRCQKNVDDWVCQTAATACEQSPKETAIQ